jgi:hypothetical protein
MLLQARTDALKLHGLDEAMRRMKVGGLVLFCNNNTTIRSRSYILLDYADVMEDVGGLKCADCSSASVV